MKIAIFSKPYIIKACSFFVVISLFMGNPTSANASLISDFTDKIFGGGQALADETVNSSDNIQTMDLVPSESSINPDLVKVDGTENVLIGQEGSYIESNGSFGADVTFEKSPLSDQINVYTVKEGDTLSEIADMFDVSTNTIRWENDISGQTISVGQKLNILPVTGVKHIVKSGDTVSKIADKYDADAEDVLIFNGIEKGDALKKGDLIFVPNGIIKPVVTSKPVTSSGNTTVSNTKAPSGYYLRPVPGRVTSPYGSRKGGFHPGVDLAGTKGVTPVLVAATGVVTEVVSGCVEGNRRCGGGYGNHIEVAHPNGTTTRYAHLYKTSVKLGQTVSQGKKIGVLGNSGSSTGPHLHFEVINANGSKMRPSF